MQITKEEKYIYILLGGKHNKYPYLMVSDVHPCGRSIFQCVFFSVSKREKSLIFVPFFVWFTYVCVCVGCISPYEMCFFMLWVFSAFFLSLLLVFLHSDWAKYFTETIWPKSKRASNFFIKKIENFQLRNSRPVRLSRISAPLISIRTHLWKSLVLISQK